jgi:hypothetical protein
VEEDPDGEKEALSTLVDHPEVPFLFECSRFVGGHGLGSGHVGPLKSLETPSLCLVALEMCGLGGVGIIIEVGVCVERGLRAVGEVETIARHLWVLVNGEVDTIQDVRCVDLRTKERRDIIDGARKGRPDEKERKERKESEEWVEEMRCVCGLC